MIDNIEDHAVNKVFDLVNVCPEFVDAQTLDIEIFQDLRLAIGEDLVFSDLVTVYLSSAETLLDSIQTAFTSHDVKAFSLAAHSLKSTSASIGANRLSQICRYFEKNAKTGEITIAPEFLVLLVNEYEAVINAIQACIITFMSE
ncbi:MAG: hypothetical protein DCF19_05185 [Pseudanabaena frigida]|uniref:HPt domain-containing protein n=1 Tax=Pseudanabaena frigida TaxID=945775 RepID=A0A2W4WFR3_9CYAN|nr:MAG: hypothetical protein DCF19_05185 [Pseudanabaena frigida]